MRRLSRPGTCYPVILKVQVRILAGMFAQAIIDAGKFGINWLVNIAGG